MTRNLWLILAALGLAGGLGLGWIFHANTDLPAGGQAAYQAFFSAAAQRGQSPYDARLLATESLGLQLVSLACVLALIARELRPAKLAGLIAALLACLVFSPLAPRPLPVTSGLSGLTRNLSLNIFGGGPGFWPSLATLVPWGYVGVAWLIIVSIPAATLSLSVVDDAESRKLDPDRVLSFLALVAVAALFLLAAYGATAAAGRELCFMAVLLNAAILIGQPRPPIRCALWFLAVLIPLLDPIAEPEPPATGPDLESAVTAELRHQVASGQLFPELALQRVLPESIRPTLPIEARDGAVTTETAAALPASQANPFRAHAVPELAGLDGLPTWGNWTAAGAPFRTGRFVSTPFHSTSGIVQIRVAGTLKPPETALDLQDAKGRFYHALISQVSAADRWRRINFEVPPGNYQVVATVRSSATWFAFSHPQDIYWSARLANKIVQTWTWWLGTAAVMTAGLAAFVYLSAVNAARAKGSQAPWSEPLRPVLTPVIPVALVRAAPWLLLLGYALFLCHHIDPTAGPNDSGGYLNSAKLLASHHTTAEPRLLLPGPRPADLSPYLPGTFVATPDGRLAPTYPVGFPLIVAGVAQGIPIWAAVPLVILIQICLGLLLTYLLAREFDLPRGWALFAAAIVGLSPVYLFQSLQPQSDGPALVWVTASVYLAWTSIQHRWRALAAGATTAMAVLIRPSNILCLVPIIIALYGYRRQIALWIIGGLPGAVFQFWYDQRLYGHGLSTGYGNAGEVSSGFGWRFAPLTAHAYLHWLPAFFTPLVFLSLVGPWLPIRPRRARLMLGAWAAVFLLFYTFYWCTYDNWYNMRFVLPAAPALVILALWTARWLCGLRPIPLLIRSVTALVLLGALVERCAAERVFFWMRANRVNADAAQWARDHLPGNAVIVGKHITGPLFYYTDLALLRTDSAPAQSPAFYAALEKAGRPVYALTFHWERHGYQWGNGKGDGYPDAPGHWEHLAAIGDDEVHAWKRTAEPAAK